MRFMGFRKSGSEAGWRLLGLKVQGTAGKVRGFGISNRCGDPAFNGQLSFGKVSLE